MRPLRSTLPSLIDLTAEAAEDAENCPIID
jgi:hypothetical protein